MQNNLNGQYVGEERFFQMKLEKGSLFGVNMCFKKVDIPCLNFGIKNRVCVRARHDIMTDVRKIDQEEREFEKSLLKTHEEYIVLNLNLMKVVHWQKITVLREVDVLERVPLIKVGEGGG
jgi:hypothetical protein